MSRDDFKRFLKPMTPELAAYLASGVWATDDPARPARTSRPAGPRAPSREEVVRKINDLLTARDGIYRP